MLLFGGAWLYASAHGSVNLAGLMFLNTDRGSWRKLAFKVGPENEDTHGWADTAFCPGQNLVLLQCGLRQTFKATVRIYSYQGVQLHKFQCSYYMNEPLWSPSGQAVAFHQGHMPQFPAYVWRPTDSAPVFVDVRARGLYFRWQTPYTGRALFLDESSLAVIDVQNPSQVTTLPLPQQVAVPKISKRNAPRCLSCSVAWGLRLILPHSSASMGLYSVEGDVLALEHTVAAEAGRQFAAQDLQLKGGGELCATVTGVMSSYCLRSCHLAIIDLASGCLREYPLQAAFEMDTSRDEELRVRWSLSESAVLVSTENGSLSELISFA